MDRLACLCSQSSSFPAPRGGPFGLRRPGVEAMIWVEGKMSWLSYKRRVIHLDGYAHASKYDLVFEPLDCWPSGVPGRLGRDGIYPSPTACPESGKEMDLG